MSAHTWLRQSTTGLNGMSCVCVTQTGYMLGLIGKNYYYVVDMTVNVKWTARIQAASAGLCEKNRELGDVFPPLL